MIQLCLILHDFHELIIEQKCHEIIKIIPETCDMCTHIIEFCRFIIFIIYVLVKFYISLFG